MNEDDFMKRVYDNKTEGESVWRILSQQWINRGDEYWIVDRQLTEGAGMEYLNRKM